MVPFDAQNFIRTLRRAITNGDIPMSRIDDAVRRILRVKFELGLFERPLMDDSLLDSVGSAEHRAIARQAVRESLVLLKNENEALPIDKEVGRIFVAGQHADDLGLQSGGWTIEWQGGSGDITDGTTILDGITSAVGTDTEIVYDRFGKFERVEGNADIGIVVLGERPYAEGQGDRADLDVNPLMIERVAERADTVILILVTGRPLVITEAMKFADAVVVAWLPGTEGNGVSDVLFGDFDFTGKLSFSWMRTMEQLPFDFAEMADSGCDAPLFPYGYGLTMAEFVPVVVPVCEDD
jgi:beta-glucosidase